MEREKERPRAAFTDGHCTGISSVCGALYTIKMRVVMIDMIVKKKSN